MLNKIMRRVSDFIEYHGKEPNILIMGRELEKELFLSVNSLTLTNDLIRLKNHCNLLGDKMFKIVAVTDDIDGYMVMYNTIR